MAKILLKAYGANVCESTQDSKRYCVGDTDTYRWTNPEKIDAGRYRIKRKNRNYVYHNMRGGGIVYRVIIVEDEMFVRIGLEHAIDWSSYDMQVVATASNGKEALSLYEKWKPHLIITDIKMPIMNGIDLISEIRKQDKHIKFIIISCMEDFKMARAALINSVSFYIVKSDMNIKELNDSITSIHKELRLQEKQPGRDFDGINEKQDQMERITEYLLSGKNFNWNSFNTIQKKGNALRLAACLVRRLEYSENAEVQRTYNSVKDVICEILENEGKGQCIAYFKNEFVLLYQDSILISESLEYLRDRLRSYFNLEVVCLLGTPFLSLWDIKQQFEELQSLTYSFFYLNKASIISKTDPVFDMISEQLQQQISPVLKCYKNNFDNEFSEEFFQFSSLILNSRELYSDICKMKNLLGQWLQLFMTIMHLINDATVYYKAEIMEQVEKSDSLQECISLILQFMERLRGNSENNQKISYEIMRALDYIKNHLSEELTLPAVAAQVNFSAGYLSYMFKQELNTSFTDFVMNLRIKKAKILLTQSDLKLYEIAEKTGYHEASYFNKVFKKATGVTPNQYRETQRKVTKNEKQIEN
jgi:two-component system, response regulator YesN